MTVKRLCYLFVFFFTIQLLVAQVSVRASLDSSSLLIGAQTNLRLELIHNKNLRIQHPILKDSIVSGLEILSVAKPDTVVQENEMISVTTNVLITAFDSALYYIPPFIFISENDTFETNPLSLKVYSFSVDTTKGVYDIKPIYKAKINWKLVLFVVLSILLSLIVLFVLYRFVIKRFFTKQLAVVSEKLPDIAPHETALKELDRIKSEKIWQQGRLKEYYTEVSTVLRQYIEHRYLIAALEMTSDEILENIKVAKISDAFVFERLQQVLLLSDLVKFAKWIPDTMEQEKTLQNAYSFVNETKDEQAVVVENKEIESEIVSN